MKAQKWLAAAAIVITATAGLVACSSSSGTTAKTGTINFTEDKGWNYDPLSTAAKKEIGVSLKTSTYSDQNQFQAFVKQSLRTPKAPDIFTWHTGTQLEQLVKQGLVADTSSIWKQAIADKWVSPAIEKMFTINGKQYCVPLEVDYWGMYYNKAMFAKYNLTPPTTWSGMLDVAATLKSHGITPFYSQSGNPWAFVWYMITMTGTDVSQYNAINDGKASYTDPQVKAAMDVWLQMLQKGYFSDPGSKTQSQTNFKDGQSAMQPFGTWYPGTLGQVGMKPGTDWGIFPIPAIKTQNGKTPVAVEPAPVCVTAKGANKTLALKYAQWLMSPKAQTTWSKAQGILPYNPQATAANATLQDFGKQVTDEAKFEAYLRYYEAAPAPVLTAALNNFTGFMTNPGDPTKYLQSIESTSAQYWASNK
ncbi:ABC transporter substrate-binding protein [Rathayibacter soli]|uniref:ABC transporter substrate-binding protein n=1 Tax=Rathayibacter soli TaxID=3144168 RepID=UPI0027E548CD|nr:extracellular solute-binding protein [Glaciibacter superstes]